MLKLEVGKKYKSVRGQIREIVRVRDIVEYDYPFVDDCGDTYKEDGRYLTGGSDKDLVKEVTSFNLDTQPWFIRINSEDEFNLTIQWLKDNGFTLDIAPVSYRNRYGNTLAISNGHDEDDTHHCLCYVTEDQDFYAKHNRPEIKINFKTLLEVDTVEYPEVVDKDEEERIAIRKEMEALAERLKALEGN